MDSRYQDPSFPPSPPGYSSTSSSPPSSSASPRSSRHGSLPDTTTLGIYSHTALNAAAAPPSQSSSSPFEDLDRDTGFTSSNSDSYDSAGESSGRALQYYEGSYSSTSRISSRANSPAPPEHWDRFNNDSLSYRATPRSRSRVPSGATTPTNGAGDKEAYGPDCE